MSEYANCFSLNYIHAHQHSIRIPDPRFNQMVSTLNLIDLNNTQEAIGHFDKIANILVGKFGQFPDDLFILVFHEVIKSLFELSKIDEFSGYVAKKLRELTPRVHSTNPAYMPLLNCIAAIFIRIKNYKEALRVVDNLQQNLSNDLLQTFLTSDIANFYYLSGYVKLLFHDFERSAAYLNGALNLCPRDSLNDLRRILLLQIPVMLALGYCIDPDSSIFEEFNFDLYRQLTIAVANADLEHFRAIVDSNQILFIKMGIWEVIESAQITLESRILQMAFKSYGSTQIPFRVSNAAFQVFFGNSESEEDTVMKCCLMKKVGLVKTTLFPEPQHQLLVFPKSGQFQGALLPKLSFD